MSIRKTPPDTASSPLISGRLVEDDRGNNIWEHKTETGGFSRDVDTQRVLKALNNNDLALEGSDGTTPAQAFNPYNFNPFDKEAGRPADTKPRKSIADLRKLSEQIKQAKGGAAK